MIFTFLILASVFIQSTFTTIPLVLNTILLSYVLTKDSRIFLFAFIAGILFDLSLVNHLGQTSIFLMVFLFLITLYEKKFEIANAYFILIYSFLANLLFLKIFDFNYIFSQAILSAAFSVILFKLIKLFKKKNHNEESI